MAQRDYAARSGSKKKKSGSLSPMLIIVALVVVLGFAFGLYFMKASSDAQPVQTATKVEKAKPKSQLPSRPEETWSYIKELESRTVPTSDDALATSAKLNEKQKEALKRLEEAERQKAAQAKAAAEQAQTATSATEEAKVLTSTEEEKIAAKKAADEKAAEEKRQAEQRRKAELAKQEAAKKAETSKTDTAKSEAEKSKKSDNAKVGKYGLQCGAFNDRGKAEALQGKLAMIGLNARITQSGKWHRVVVGPVGDRPAATQAQQQASSVERCVIIGM